MDSYIINLFILLIYLFMNFFFNWIILEFDSIFF